MKDLNKNIYLILLVLVYFINVLECKKTLTKKTIEKISQIENIKLEHLIVNSNNKNITNLLSIKEKTNNFLQKQINSIASVIQPNLSNIDVNKTLTDAMADISHKFKCFLVNEDLSVFDLNEGNNVTGISINLPQGDVCNQITKEKYNITLKLICDANLGLGEMSPIFSTFAFDPLTKCSTTFEILSANACSLSNFFPFLKFLEKYKIFAGAAMIVIGILLCLWGTRFIEYTFVCILGLICIQFGLKFYKANAGPNPNPDYIWIVIAVSFLIGIALAYFAMNMITVAKLCIGGYLGYILSLLVFQFLLRYINTDKPQIMQWITMGVCVILGCILITFLVKQVMMIATSFLGAYSIIRGFSLYAKNFPNEQIISELLKNQEFEQLADQFTGTGVFYLLGFAVFFAGGLLYQCNFFPEETEDHKYFAK